MAQPKRVVCLGASMVRGQFSASFVEMLKQRMSGFEFINEGVNGNLAYNLRQRLAPVIAQQPDYIVMLIGTNDITGTFSPALGENLRRTQKLPQLPSLAWYRENMQAIVKHLQEHTHAKIALCSLPNVGEDLDSQVNVLTRTYNAALAEIAAQAQITYIPVNERQTDYLRQHQTTAGRALEADMFNAMTLKFLFYHFVLRFSFDRIARKNGFLLSAEGIHMNTTGATIIADAIEAFLRS